MSNRFPTNLGATFCRDAVTPKAAEECLSSCLTPQPSIACYGSNTDFTPDELEALDSEGPAILTEHTLPEGNSVVIINVYCPRADKENKERVDFKMNFYKLLQERAESLVNAGRYGNCMFLLFGFFVFNICI